ncbi:Metallo-dependent phosphatase-like protein [Syncephalis pseudoplumigaleata]|uniref:Metallo-dependent phosphatase-like protein n=1 Tax=Syncephalis pseudoplumigaleata TaxID=1712513 RepID=A0A4P9Z2P7_9FUNG|nr:Metallo-dependent phosphatase-like protein [Syncephalis pseudoplumigaleata]|eukprot:RKP26645.1 Metallo-dependent phosphatase-like protein [Syncephalis pseudoplumigaleata]
MSGARATRMLRGLPRFSRVKRLLMLVVLAGLVLLWLTAGVLYQALHEAKARASFYAWSNGWLGCGWRKEPLLAYWNSSHISVTGETSCLLPANVWLLWRAQEYWSPSEPTHKDDDDKEPGAHNWSAILVRPVVYDDHHYVYRGLIPLTPTGHAGNTSDWLATRFSYLWSWDQSRVAVSKLGASLPADLTQRSMSTPESSFIHYHGPPPPPPSSSSSAADASSLAYKDMRIAMVADNQFKRLKYLKVLRQMARHEPAFWLHGGDCVQHAGRLIEWDMDFFAPVAAAGLHRIPLLYTRGNHDDTRDRWSWGADEGHIYHQPSPSWFAITLGGARWIVLDSNRDSPEQEAFLRDELASKAAAAASFLIVLVHIPPYIEYWDREGWEEHGERYWGRFVLDKYDGLFAEHHVDLVISGHQHNYQRGRRNHTAYTIIGGGGGDLDEERVTDWHMYEKTALTHHYAVVTLGRDKLVWNAYDADGASLDTFEIARRQ